MLLPWNTGWGIWRQRGIWVWWPSRWEPPCLCWVIIIIASSTLCIHWIFTSFNMILLHGLTLHLIPPCLDRQSNFCCYNSNYSLSFPTCVSGWPTSVTISPSHCSQSSHLASHWLTGITKHADLSSSINVQYMSSHDIHPLIYDSRGHLL